MTTYRILLRGQVDVDQINARSPHQMTVEQSGPSATLVSICTDQAGLIGLMRHLHGLGYALLSITCQEPHFL
jgi:hypothetical protein